MIKLEKTRLFRTLGYILYKPEIFFRHENYDVKGALSFIFRFSMLTSILGALAFFPFRLLGLFYIGAAPEWYQFYSLSLLFDVFITPFVVGFFVSFSALIYSLVNHIFIKIFGGKGGFSDTVSVQSFSQTPGLLFSWIPFLGPFMSLFMGIYGFYISVIGFSEKHKISKLRAFLALIFPVILAVVLVSLLVLALISVLGVGTLGLFGSETLKIVNSNLLDSSFIS